MSQEIQKLLQKQVELSYFTPQNFYMFIEGYPELVYTCQRIQNPVLTGEEELLPNPANSSKVMIPGNSMDYSVLSCDFIIDKDFKNYKSILEWMKFVYTPESGSQVDELYSKRTSNFKGFQRGMSNVRVVGTDPGLNPLVEWNYKDCFPISLDGTLFDSTLPDIEYLTSNVTFRFKYFVFNTYTDGISNQDHI